uniref:tRNA pseudouridine synthase n=1 Tax=Ananas comosus var. bracteatus TaxID=296719 RepID=A0A6V7QH33_ANACO|nr:unnamed protein product [Ananas comosus var. bracteatus]
MHKVQQRKQVQSPPKTPNRNLIVIESYLRFSSYAAMNEEGEASSHAELSSASHSESKRPLDLPSDSLKPLKISRSSTEGAEKEANDRGEKQPNCRTVVGALEDAFLKFIGQPVSIFCSSRTDAGVHALSNVCHVDVERISKRKPGEVLPPHDPGVVRRAVNHFLQRNEGDIMVTDVRCVPPDFHARFKALERTYHYRLLSGPAPLSTFEKDRAWHVPEDLDVHAMKDACGVLVGCRDFSSFRQLDASYFIQANSPIRTLDELTVTEVFPALYFPSIVESVVLKNGQIFGHRSKHRCYVITARARSFLYHQVRLMVGVLKSVGTGDLTTTDVEQILNAKTVTAASPMAPACGLYLGSVKYDLS